MNNPCCVSCFPQMAAYLNSTIKALGLQNPAVHAKKTAVSALVEPAKKAPHTLYALPYTRLKALRSKILQLKPSLRP